jgi:hypothetical protein
VTWRRTRDEPPNSDRGGIVLAHYDRYDQVRIVNVADVRQFPHMYPWWAEITRPPRD